MSPELDEQLCKKYPKIFADRHADMRTTAMCWGFEIGDGWYDIIDSLCRVLQSEVDRSQENYDRIVKENGVIDSVLRGETELFEKEYGPLTKSFYATIYQDIKDGIRKKREPVQPIPQVKAVQVKEKFGTLRFYTDFESDKMRTAIDFAELMSAKTCEVCGDRGTMNEEGWRSVRCNEHRK